MITIVTPNVIDKNSEIYARTITKERLIDDLHCVILDLYKCKYTNIRLIAYLLATILRLQKETDEKVIRKIASEAFCRISMI